MINEVSSLIASVEKRMLEPYRMHGRRLLAYCRELRIIEDMRLADERDIPSAQEQCSPEVHRLLEQAVSHLNRASDIADSLNRHKFCGCCGSRLDQPLGKDLYYADEESYCDACVVEYDGTFWYKRGAEKASNDAEVQPLPPRDAHETMTAYLRRCRNDHTNYLTIIETRNENTNLDELAYTVGLREAFDILLLKNIVAAVLGSDGNRPPH